MATYSVNAPKNNQTLTFNPTVDTLSIDDADLDAASGIVLQGGSDPFPTYNGKSVQLLHGCWMRGTINRGILAALLILGVQSAAMADTATLEIVYYMLGDTEATSKTFDMNATTRPVADDVNDLLGYATDSVSPSIPQGAQIINITYKGRTPSYIHEVTLDANTTYDSCNISSIFGKILAHKTVTVGSGRSTLDLSTITFKKVNTEACSSHLPPTHEGINGIYGMMNPENPSYDSQSGYVKTTLASPKVDGVFVRILWDKIQTNPEGWNWSDLETWFSSSNNTQNKKLSISVIPGKHTPLWVYGAGARSMISKVRDRGYTDDFCKTAVIPVPWDPVYLQAWVRFVHAFGERYGDNQLVSLVKFTGINFITAETILPHGTEATVADTDCPDIFPNDVETWRNLGYNSDRITDAFKIMLTAFGSAFPNVPIAIMTDSRALPPLGKPDPNTGKAIDNPSAEFLPMTFLQGEGRGILGKRLVGQNNALTTSYVNTGIAAHAQTHLTGYQQMWPVTNDDACVMNSKRASCDAATVFETALYNARKAGAQYFEIMPVDAMNAALQSTLDIYHGNFYNALSNPNDPDWNSYDQPKIDPTTTGKLTVVYLEAANPSELLSIPNSVSFETPVTPGTVDDKINYLLGQAFPNTSTGSIPDSVEIKSVQYVGPMPSNKLYLKVYNYERKLRTSCDPNYLLSELLYEQNTSPYYVNKPDSTDKSFWRDEVSVMVTNPAEACNPNPPPAQ
jgi:hypothetical protein